MSPARSLLLPPLSIAVIAGAGFAICRSAGQHPLPANVLASGSAALAGCLMAGIPLWLTRHGNQAVVAQASLIGMTLHLIVTLVGAAIAYVTRLGGATQGVLWWVLAFYGASLIALVVVFVKTLNAAPLATSSTATQK